MSRVSCGEGNIQYANVGNVGDILKHGALLALARLLQVRCEDQPLAYLDTHAFLVEAPLAHPEWDESVTALCRRCPGYGLYRHAERPYTQRGEYLCSVGLAHASLSDARWFLSEVDDVTRADLQRQLAERGVDPDRLLDSAAKWGELSDAPVTGGFVGLVDPFRLDGEDWSAARDAVEAVWTRGTPGLLQVFAYDENVSYAGWPPGPAGWTGPVATLDHEAYHLALYATADLVEPALRVLEPLGWSGGDA